jgi:hypothetical protein
MPHQESGLSPQSPMKCSTATSKCLHQCFCHIKATSVSSHNTFIIRWFLNKFRVPWVSKSALLQVVDSETTWLEVSLLSINVCREQMPLGSHLRTQVPWTWRSRRCGRRTSDRKESGCTMTFSAIRWLATSSRMRMSSLRPRSTCLRPS